MLLRYPACATQRFRPRWLATGLPRFYDPATTNPAVVAADEANKDTTTATELGGGVAILGEPPAEQPSSQITVPVLSVVGENDSLFCTGVTAYNCADPASVQAFEAQYYSPPRT
jgi:hypothetical protein